MLPLIRLFDVLVLRDLNIAHKSTLRCLDLIEQLSLVSDLDGEHLGRRVRIMLKLRFEALSTIDSRNLKHFILELSRWLDLLDHGSMNLTWCETMRELLLLLRISAVFV